ncbi:MAG: hypothetical protein SFY92_00715 [Verrucomicrobiae bacterium]|nr:hypothetical protein [Verrucomicrobiae bacterium]
MQNNDPQTTDLTSRSRLSPVKKSEMSLPKLCAVLLISAVTLSMISTTFSLLPKKSQMYKTDATNPLTITSNEKIDFMRAMSFCVHIITIQIIILTSVYWLNHPIERDTQKNHFQEVHNEAAASKKEEQL